MKFLNVLGLLLLFLFSCRERNPVSNMTAESNNEPTHLLDTSWNNIDAKILTIVGASDITEKQQGEGKIIYRMIKFDASQQNSEIYELNNIRDKSELKYWKFEIDSECNPVTGPRNFSSACVHVKEKLIKYISKEKFDSLTLKFKENEFWELSEFESEKNNHRGWINDEPTWVIEAISIDKKKLSWDSVVLVRNYHRIERSFIEEYPSVFNIGTYIKSL